MSEDARLILYRSARAYVQKVLQFLADNCVELGPTVPLGEWVKESDDTFIVRDRQLAPGGFFLAKHSAEVGSFKEYADFVAALRMDEVIAPQLNGLVGTPHSRRTLLQDVVLNRIALQMAESVTGFRFDSAEFDRLFEQFLSDLKRTTLNYVGIAPLPGLKSDAIPIRLGEDIEIDLLTEREISQCLSVNLPLGVQLGEAVRLNGRCGIRRRFTIPKWVGPRNQTSSDSSGPMKRWSQSADRVSNVVDALRLFKRGQISCPGVVSFSEDWPAIGTSGSSFLGSGTVVWNNYTLTGEEARELSSFWEALRKARDVPFIDAAARRFGYAGERHRPDDRLVDLIIAAESLFLSDTGKASERGELRFRLSLRCAWFIEHDASSRQARFRHIRAAYDARSALIHGNQPDPKDLKLPGEGEVPLSRFIEGTEDQLRLALHHAIDIAASSNVKSIDWDSIIFG